MRCGGRAPAPARAGRVFCGGGMDGAIVAAVVTVVGRVVCWVVMWRASGWVTTVLAQVEWLVAG